MLSVAQQRNSEGHPLLFGYDLAGTRCIDSQRETRDDEADATKEELAAMLKDGWTIQFHQPQRFDDPLWRLCAALEANLGCLVGANAYITPPGHQGFAPHWDDVDVFILQVEGEKRWKVHIPDHQLANFSAADIPENKLGSPAWVGTLKSGDILFLPRGCIHQAVAGEETRSTHITLSTNQHCSILDLASHVLIAGLSTPSTQLTFPTCIKSVGIHSALNNAHSGSDGDDATNSMYSLKTAKALRELADHIENSSDGEKAVRLGIDHMAEDFMHSRLPPHPVQILPRGPCPGLDSIITARAPRCFLLFFGMDEELQFHPLSAIEDEEASNHMQPTVRVCHGPPRSVRLASSLHNSRDTHMIGGDESVECMRVLTNCRLFST